MADFKVANLCGASPEFNAIQTKFESMMTSATDGLEVDASALKATLDTDVTSLVADLKAMIPALPALPNVNLQGQLTSLSSLIPGSGQYTRLLADITTKFGTELTASGFSLDTLVSDAATAITGAGNLCDAVPNFEVPAAGGNAVQKASEVLQATEDSLPEKPSVQLANSNVTAAKTKAVDDHNKYFRKSTETETLPTKDTGAYTVASKSTAVAASAGGKVSTIKVTTSRDATVVDEDGKSVKSNVSKDGFSNQLISTKTIWSLRHSEIHGAPLLGWRPASNYFPRVAGYVNLTHLSESDATTTNQSMGAPGWTKEEIKRGWGMKQIFPDGHPGSFGLSFESKELGKTISAQAGAQQGKKITDTYLLEESGKEHLPIRVVLVTPTLYDYTGSNFGQTGKAEVQFFIKYKFNSKYDPN